MKTLKRLPFWLAAACACATIVHIAAFMTHRNPESELLAQAAIAAVLGTLFLLSGVLVACLESKTRVRSLGLEFASAQRLASVRSWLNR